MPNCLNCGNDFTPKNPKGKCCSDKCRVSWNRKNKGVIFIGDTKPDAEKIVEVSNKIVKAMEKKETGEPVKGAYMNDAIKKKLGI